MGVWLSRKCRCASGEVTIDGRRRASRPQVFSNRGSRCVEPVWRFQEQGTFTRTEALRTINDYLGQDGCQSDEIVILELDGPFVE